MRLMRTPSTHQVTDPITHALAYLATADEHAENARQARDLDSHEAHRLAGRFREEERLCLQRAKILAEISQAQALEAIADAAARIGLAL